MLIVKVGGGKDINWEYIAQDLKKITQPVILIHGANAWMKEVSNQFGLAEKMITSPSGHISRHTDQKTMEVLTMVYSGLINKRIVACLQKYGLNAIGLSGADGKVWLGEKKEAILSKEGDKVKMITDSANGNVKSINTKLVNLLLENGYLPVLTIPAITAQGELINVDNDRATAVMVKDLGVKEVVMLFEAPGLLENPKDNSSIIKRIDKKDLEKNLQATEGRMRKKILGIKETFLAGAKKVYLGDGRVESPITSALGGKGTIIS